MADWGNPVSGTPIRDTTAAVNTSNLSALGEFHPLDDADTPAAYTRNRRIEIKLTQP